ncbi:MAG: hypothetical protein HQL65_02880 [Magnetococcales bacterium]|nr:hypothetical protein [Magnetococcales bacterium]
MIGNNGDLKIKAFDSVEDCVFCVLDLRNFTQTVNHGRDDEAKCLLHRFVTLTALATDLGRF